MAGSDLRWYPIASVFPATLDADSDPTKLKDGVSPDAYGLGIDIPGVLYAGTCPTGTAQITKTYTISPNTWSWFYRRLWRISSANLLYCAPEYTATAAEQDLGVLSFDEDANALITFFPFAGDRMFVAKSTGGYQVLNADSVGGKFQHTNIVESMKVGTAGYACEFNQVAYACNGNGLMAWDGNEVNEITAKVRSGTVAAHFQSKALTIDHAKRRIIGTSCFVYEPGSGRLFDYVTSGFRYTTRAVTNRNNAPFAVKHVGFAFRTTDNNEARLTLQVRRDKDWEPEETVILRYEPNQRSFYDHALKNMWQARKFQIRITAMSGNLRILELNIQSDPNIAEEGYSG